MRRTYGLCVGVSLLFSGCAGDLIDEESWREDVPLRLGAREPNQGAGLRRPNGNGNGASPSEEEPDAGGSGGNSGSGGSGSKPGTTPNPKPTATVPPGGTTPQPIPTSPPTSKKCRFVELEGCPDVPTEIFAVGCGTERCHGSAGKPPLGFTDLGYSINDLTERLLDASGTPGEACSGTKLLDPKNPEQSLLFRKLDPDPPCGLRMPFGIYQISDLEKECIRRWGLAVIAGQTVERPCFEEQ